MIRQFGRWKLFVKGRKCIVSMLRKLTGIFSTPPDREPRKEIAKRAAEAGAGLNAMAQAEGTLNHWQVMKGAVNRVKDTHGLHMKLLGGEKQFAGDDETGDVLSVTGDQKHTHIHQRGNPVWPLLTGAALAAGALWWYLSDDEKKKPAVNPGQNYQVDVEVIPPKGG